MIIADLNNLLVSESFVIFSIYLYIKSVCFIWNGLKDLYYTVSHSSSSDIHPLQFIIIHLLKRNYFPSITAIQHCIPDITSENIFIYLMSSRYILDQGSHTTTEFLCIWGLQYDHHPNCFGNLGALFKHFPCNDVIKL